MTDHEDLRKALIRAEQKVLWDQMPARVRHADRDVNAYPVRRSGGRVVWNIELRESKEVLAYGVI